MNTDQLDLPIQPAEQPILCSPYKEPDAHWVYDTETGEASQNPGRREAGYWYKTQRTGTEQLQMRFVQEEAAGRPATGECVTRRCPKMERIELPERHQRDARTAKPLDARG